MVNIALHVQNRHARGLGDSIDVGVANLPIAVADGDAVVIAAKDFPDFLGSIPMGDLGGLAFNEARVPA